MRSLVLALAGLLAVIQYPLWIGKGGWFRVWELDSQVGAQRAKNTQLEGRNASLGAEVSDLKTGTEAIEERARYELGLIRGDEVFYQIVPDKKTEKK